MAEHGAPGPVAEAAWIDGRAGTAVSVRERGLHYGDGLFETIACLDGAPRLLELHMRRLRGGCERLGIEPPEPAQLAHEVHALCAGASRAILKILVTRGTAIARGYRPSGDEKPTRIVLRYAWPAPDPGLALEGVRVRTAQLRLGENPALAGLKHCNRLEQVLASRESHDPGLAESLMFSSSGALICGTMSNVFLVDDSILLTPALEQCGVCGVMRELVLRAAAGAGIATQVRRLEAQELARAQEVFLTNALIGIRPVRELDGVTRRVGPITRRLQQELAPLLSGGKSP
jgi:4-amino-4-deoxychorismate lyase